MNVSLISLKYTFTFTINFKKLYFLSFLAIYNSYQKGAPLF